MWSEGAEWVWGLQVWVKDEDLQIHEFYSLHFSGLLIKIFVFYATKNGKVSYKFDSNIVKRTFPNSLAYNIKVD